MNMALAKKIAFIMACAIGAQIIGKRLPVIKDWL